MKRHRRSRSPSAVAGIAAVAVLAACASGQAGDGGGSTVPAAAVDGAATAPELIRCPVYFEPIGVLTDRVRVTFLVLEDGTVDANSVSVQASASPVAGRPASRENIRLAVAAARSCLYRPAQRAGTPVRRQVTRWFSFPYQGQVAVADPTPRGPAP